MDHKDASRSKHIWLGPCVLLVFVGVVLELVLPGVSDTIKVVLLGSGLLAAGIWGRRKLRQGC